ncbi:mycofactocin biosynthesis glycosyltransferase MftF [Allobranchiibius sp. CTAmp26]|uniref:mycofactocin biosynthesis glycosyltransferase MftF n=1 Tax=Allobranchiibius sp. CTAmp26 TaxID=2815214 RepID=UPI001AA119A2|nr:mycofactocin biosynthesis glycosyltransferase MftF [Allobranchiibius sp. CTAmp26]MBO1753920.1 mycofactocin biosynthesis glycosyltransferase MftF [Allobranchiibius sp. CTAmp26]
MTTAEALVPAGVRVRLSDDVVRCDGGNTLFGTRSGRILRLAPVAVRMLQDGDFTVADRTGAVLSRALFDRGMADPLWPVRASEADPADALRDVTVVVPVRDRPRPLATLLASLPPVGDVLVVDDGSLDADAVTAVCAAAGARVVRHPASLGPAAARNTGIARCTTEFVAVIDSDVVPDEHALTHLRRHFDDPLVGVVGPRILGVEGDAPGWIARYEAASSSLDLGPVAGPVAPLTRLSYLPSATLMLRVRALGSGFDADLQVAEDVDLVWRMVADGWRARYAPEAQVRHDHRTSAGAWMSRKSYYGTGAALLAQRHGALVAPMRLHPLSAAVVALTATQRRSTMAAAAGLATVQVLLTAQRVRTQHRDHPLRLGATLTVMSLTAAAAQTGAALTRHHWPVALLLATRSRRTRRMLVVAALTCGARGHRSSELDPVRYLLARRIDDLAYGFGLWRGAVTARSPRCLMPTFTSLRPARAAAPPAHGVPLTPTREGTRHG